MDPDIGIVLGLLVVAVGLFATRALPVDLVTIFLLLALVLTGISSLQRRLPVSVRRSSSSLARFL
jgi:hypothetical protein